MIEWQEKQIIKYKVVKQLNNKSLVGPQECKTGWHYTTY